jgi:endonuclease G
MKKFLIILALLAGAAQAACPNLYPVGLTAANRTELCNGFFVTVYDEVAGRPVFSAELLKQGTSVGTPGRLNTYRQDSRLKKSPTNAAYAKSGYDRGHLAPAYDASTDAELRATFLLSNMTPQNPGLNSGSWRVLELNVRKLFYKSASDVRVITIPIYGSPYAYLGVIPIPSGYWKIVQANGNEHYYYADNIPKARVHEYHGINWKNLIK